MAQTQSYKEQNGCPVLLNRAKSQQGPANGLQGKALSEIIKHEFLALSGKAMKSGEAAKGLGACCVEREPWYCGTLPGLTSLASIQVQLLPPRHAQANAQGVWFHPPQARHQQGGLHQCTEHRYALEFVLNHLGGLLGVSAHRPMGTGPGQHCCPHSSALVPSCWHLTCQVPPRGYWHGPYPP